MAPGDARRHAVAPGVPLWLGHAIGYHIVQAYLATHPDADLAEWLALDAAAMLAESGYEASVAC